MVRHGGNIWAGCTNGRLMLLDFKRGKPINTFGGHKKDILSLGIVNSKHLWSGGADGFINVWSLEKPGKMKSQSLKGHAASVTCITTATGGAGDSGSTMTSRSRRRQP